MTPLHPLRFEPLLKRYLWGGRRLGTLLGKPIGEHHDYAESWEVADPGRDPRATERNHRWRCIACIVRIGTRPEGGRESAEVIANVVVELIRERNCAQRGAEPHPLHSPRVQRSGDVVFDIGDDGTCAARLVAGIRTPTVLLSRHSRCDRHRGKHQGGV